MSNTIIQIRRSTSTTTPPSLQNGELAFTSNGDTLWIGSPSGSNTANVVHIGAKISYVGNATHIGSTTTGSNSELASTYAIKNYVANQFSSYSTTFSGLTDVDVATKANNDIIVYDAASGKWENHTISGTTNQTNVAFSGQNIVVGLSTNVNVAGNTVIGGTLTVQNAAHIYSTLHLEPQGALAAHTITNPTLIATANVNSFTQLSIQNQNPGANSSADIIAYPNNTLADDNTGFIDLGITGNGYNQAAYSVTGPNDGYIFQSARAGDNLGGSLVLATDSTGTNNDIKFFVGGFTFNANAPHMVLAANTRSFGINNASPVSTLSVGGGAWISGNTQTTNILPLANVSYNIGSNDKNWNGVYARTIVANEGFYTNVSGTIVTSSQPNITTVGSLTNLTVLGNTALGDATSDRISINGYVNTAIVPSADITYDLGAAGNRWRDVYANTGKFVDVTVSGNLVVQGTLTTIDTTNLQVDDSLIRLARNQNNTAIYTDAVDIGFYGVTGNTGTTIYTGLARDSSANAFVLFGGKSVSPDNAGVSTSDTLMPLYAYLNSGGLVSNSSAVTITANSTLSVSITANSLTLTTALAVGSGGTGRSSLSNNYVMVGNGTSAVTLVGSTTEGHVLQINSSGAPAFGALDGGSF